MWHFRCLNNKRLSWWRETSSPVSPVYFEDGWHQTASTWTWIQIWQCWTLSKKLPFTLAAESMLSKLWTSRTLRSQLTLCWDRWGNPLKSGFTEESVRFSVPGGQRWMPHQPRQNTSDCPASQKSRTFLQVWKLLDLHFAFFGRFYPSQVPDWVED